jgi:hypothetical protein
MMGSVGADIIMATSLLQSMLCQLLLRQLKLTLTSQNHVFTRVL